MNTTPDLFFDALTPDQQRSLLPPPRARKSHPETSHEAAASVMELTEKRSAVLYTLRSLAGATLEELVAEYRSGLQHTIPQADSGIRSRCAELVRMGRVVDSGGRRLTESGRRAIVWKVAGEA